MTLPRIITAIFLVPFMVAVVWYGSLAFFIFVSGLALLCVWEYSVMAETGGYPNQLVLSMIGVLFVVLSLYVDGAPLGPIHKAPSPIFVLLVWTVASFLREFFRRDKGHSVLRVITSIGGVILCGFFLGHLLLLRDLRIAAGEGFEFVGRPILFFLIITIWCVDTGAWFVGRSIGRFRMAPMISPKKTWEGAIGGTLIACLAAWLFREIFLKAHVGRAEAMVYAVVIAVTAQISDLMESLLKRSFGVKDSSQLLPGHGGLLDRFDSFIFAAPFFYYALLSTGRFQ